MPTLSHSRRVSVLAAAVYSLAFALPSSTSSAPRHSVQFGDDNNQDKKRAPPSDALTAIIGQIQALESHSDPKCNASATRLENFMFGTPLTPEARFTKVALQKKLVKEAWQKASALALGDGIETVGIEQMRSVTERILSRRTKPDGVEILIPGHPPTQLSARDVRQYSTVAYALRAILAVQQDSLLDPTLDFLPADDGAIRELRECLDIYTLGVLYEADRSARINSRNEVDEEDLTRAWKLVGTSGSGLVSLPQWGGGDGAETTVSGNRFPILHRIIDQKMASYQTYNDVSMAIFGQNVTSYFVRHGWPTMPEEVARIQTTFGTLMVIYTADLLRRAEAEAKRSREKLVRARNVHAVQQVEAPFSVNTYEDVTFFPHFGRDARIIIESYDLDAFRDTGLHWKFLQETIDYPSLPVTLDLDPFASELVTEAASQYGVLLFRMAGLIAKTEQSPTLLARHLVEASDKIHTLAEEHARTPPPATLTEPIASAEGTGTSSRGAFFSDVTQESGIAFRHHSSDWLSRFQRSYLYKIDEDSEDQGAPRSVDTPPSFSGGGVAADDVNGDDLPDILFLGGRGNRLFINDGHGRFLDRTEAAGITFRREDGHPGEPRQPIIADLDNDGLQDILITYARDDHRLYRNRGRGSFEDVTETAGLGGRDKVGGPATVLDFDRDGLLDIYIGYFGDYLNGVRPYLARNNVNAHKNRLFRNLGNMRFQDVTDGSGAGDTGWAQALSDTDFDGDGWQDLVVANDFGHNAYLRNKGDGTFENVTASLETDIPAHSMNVGSTDLNRDEHPDFYISNIVTLAKDEKYVLPTADTPMAFAAENLATMRIVEMNHLFVSVARDGGLARYVLSDAVKRGATSTGWSWDADFFDFDNDGDDDLYVVNGHLEYPIYDAYSYHGASTNGDESPVESNFHEKETNVFFVNESGGLLNHSSESGADFLGNSRAAAYLDHDRDGDLDIVVNNFHSGAVFLRNNSEAQANNNWLTLKLVGDPSRGSNRDAIGARLVLMTEGGKKVWRTIQGSTGYLSAHPKQQHFGLGDEQLATVSVRWPNGDEEQIVGLQANKSYRLVQGEGRVGRLPDRR